MYSIGIDIGSTTAKVVVLDAQQELCFQQYVRHCAAIDRTAAELCRSLTSVVGGGEVCMAVTGSAGMGLAERLRLPFVQELVASTAYVRSRCPDVRTLIDMGGEDTKMIFFAPSRLPDIRMNGSCAGGTGAFIDQMAALLGVTPRAFDDLAARHRQEYPIASRCGVFAKTDVQNLLSRKVPPADIAYSVYTAVAIQSMNTLARGCDILPGVLFTGGPFSFLPTLSKAFLAALHLTGADAVRVPHPHLVPAWGAAIHAAAQGQRVSLDQISGLLSDRPTATSVQGRMQPLFASDSERAVWTSQCKNLPFKQIPISQYHKTEAWIGIDSGSTTTKMVLVGEDGELLFHFYAPNNGQVVETVQRGLEEMRQALAGAPQPVTIVREAVTGYGEELVRTAFNLSDGLVETLAHYIASARFDPEVSFILDIGGQDMKAFFVQDGQVRRIELNESCSSGCGSFIETFSESLGYDVSRFADMACRASAPCDLGSRCTVFMNSRVKQALRENAPVEDIAAGLSFSVVRNALFKVLNIRDLKDIGQHVMVQGGTFRNASVRRAFELLTGVPTETTDMPELMGAYGAALYARRRSGPTVAGTPGPFNWDMVDRAGRYEVIPRPCRGCENRCHVSELRFEGGRKFYSGNKCENIFHNTGRAEQPGEDLSAWKLEQLFADSDSSGMPSGTAEGPVVGIPRALHFYEKYPFWHTLLQTAGIRTVLSPPSTMEVYRRGMGTVMSDNICFPAKLLNGHAAALAALGVNRMLYPVAVYESREHRHAVATFNCPIVSGYADVLDSALELEKRGIALDTPRVHFGDVRLLKKSCVGYLASLGVPAHAASAAFRKALEAQAAFKVRLRVRAGRLIEQACASGEQLIVLAGRPYHTDRLIHSQVPEILSRYGAHVITEDMVPMEPDALRGLQVLPQWSYTNRIYAAAAWVASAPENVQMVQINSFGCGPDAIAIDEVRAILRTGGKHLTVVRVDEINATGSIRLRLRSMLASLRYRQQTGSTVQGVPRPQPARFMPADKQRRTILGPDLGPFYSTLIRPIFTLSGYRYEPLPEPETADMQTGLRYANNEICYPATMVIGSLLSALQSGRYPRGTVAVGVTQTCGQCRASSYLSLLKKALEAAGLDDIPAIAIGTEGRTVNDQPGLRINYLGMMRCIAAAMLGADVLMKLTMAVQARELRPGTAMALAMQLLPRIEDRFVHRDPEGIYRIVEEAVEAFRHVAVHRKQLIKVGLVGEIYVKYNPFANGHIVQWLNAHGAEVVVPPLTGFFVQAFVNRKVNARSGLARTGIWAGLFTGALWKYADRCIARVNAMLQGFPGIEPFNDIRRLAELAEPLIHLENQAGEGWLIAAEVSQFAQAGIHRIISVQPFGCIANQIVSKGIEKRLRNHYPSLNLLFLDYDSNVSAVNVQNRLHFILQ